MRDIITKLEELNEGLADMAHEAEKDHEVQMARSDCYKSAKYAVAIHKMLKDVSEMEGIDGWVASKITKAADYLGSVKHYMEGQAMSDVELAVVPVAGDMTDAMTMPQESIAEGRMSMRQLASMDKDAARKIEAMVGPESKYADMGDYQEALYNAARKLGLVESEEIDEGRMSMRQLASMDKDAARKIEAMVGPESKYADMGDYQEALYNAARKLGLVESQIAEDEEADKKPDMGALLKALKKKLSDEGGAAGFDPLEKIAKDMGVDLTPAMLKGMAGIKMHRDGDYILEDVSAMANSRDAVERTYGQIMQGKRGSQPDQSEVGDYIPKGMKSEQIMDLIDMLESQGYDKDFLLKDLADMMQEDEDIIGDIIASLNKTKERMPMPKSKPKMSAVTKQKAMNKMALPKSKPDMSMAQDTTRPLTMSKFAEWSKK